MVHLVKWCQTQVILLHLVIHALLSWLILFQLYFLELRSALLKQVLDPQALFAFEHLFVVVKDLLTVIDKQGLCALLRLSLALLVSPGIVFHL